MYKFIFTVLLGISFVISSVICFKKPVIHKPMLICSYEYRVIEALGAEEPKEELNVQDTTKKKQVKNIVETKHEGKTIQSNVNNQNKKTKIDIETPKTVDKKTLIKSENKVEKTEKEIEKEEVIAWNIWRSNLQNQIMKDVKLPIVPMGTIFNFSFKVDKYGRVSNVQTWSSNPAFTPYAIEYIAPVIRKYQGKDILNFPTGSKRITTEVTGGWKISSKSKYSTPSDFTDIEKTRKGIS